MQTPERRDQLKTAKQHFNCESSKAAIDQQADETLAWMRRNDRSFSADGHERREGWFVPPGGTDDITLKVRRQRLLLDRAYEHGILHFMFGLVEKGIVPRLDSKQIDLLVDAMTPVVINELAGFPLIGKENEFFPLSKIRDLFGNGKNTKPAYIRDRRLIPLAKLGILEGTERKDGYQIKIGYIGLVFFRDVYARIVAETDVGFCGSSK
jgi:hypothetical protein